MIISDEEPRKNHIRTGRDKKEGKRLLFASRKGEPTMSMNTYGGLITGCVIRDIDGFINRYVECHPEEFEGKKKDDKRQEMEDFLICNEAFIKSSAEGKADIFHAQMYRDDPYYDTASMYHLTDVNSWQEDLGMPFILVETDRFLTTKTVLEGKFYQNKAELVEEFKSKLERYLPEDFDYESNIGDIEYAVCC